MLIKYADYFDVTTDYILCRDRNKKENVKNQLNINGGTNYGKITMK